MSLKPSKLISITIGCAVLVLLILYTGGFLTTGKIKPGKENKQTVEPKGKIEEIKVQVQNWPDQYEAVGTVRPRTEAQVEAQVRARVLKVLVNTGDRVKEGQLLLILGQQEYSARVEQNRQDLEAAKAAQRLAQTEYGRLSRLSAVGATPKRDLDRAKEALQRTNASTLRAEKRLEEALIALSYTKIQALEPGQVIKRLIDPGDLALPGRPLLILQTGTAMRLEALVREGLIGKVRMGQELNLSIPALDETMTGKITEIAPAADPKTRAFLVKVLLPEKSQVYSGMFGRLLIPVGKRQVVVIPQKAITRVGQLEMVFLKTPEGLKRIHITTGREMNEMVEVLSGLNGNETLAIGQENDR